MRIKNKDKLVARATAHKKADRFIASSYIEYLDGEDEEFHGCEITCLATPEDLGARKRWFKKYSNSWSGEPLDVEIKIPVDDMIAKIEREFGVCRTLQRAAECFLMEIDTSDGSDPTPARLGGFTLSFCRALPEGVDVRNEHVWAWLQARGSYVESADNERFNGTEFLRPTYEYRVDWDKERRAFLDWLRRGCPKPKGTS